MADRPFLMSFHHSDHPGPSNPMHPMHMTYASTAGISLLVAYGLIAFVFLIWSILTVLPNVLVAQEAAEIGAAELATQVAAQLVTELQTEGAEIPDDLDAQVATAVTDAIAHQPKRVEAGLLTLVLSFGAAGGLVHLLSSLGRFVGERTLQRSWLLFYYLRPPVGAVLGLFAYLILRMGVLSPGSATSVNVYGVLTFAALAGMFSRQAIDKFAEVFDMLFQKTKENIGGRTARQLFADEGRDDASVPLPAGPTPTESFKDEERTHG